MKNHALYLKKIFALSLLALSLNLTACAETQYANPLKHQPGIMGDLIWKYDQFHQPIPDADKAVQEISLPSADKASAWVLSELYKKAGNSLHAKDLKLAAKGDGECFRLRNDKTMLMCIFSAQFTQYLYDLPSPLKDRPVHAQGIYMVQIFLKYPDTRDDSQPKSFFGISRKRNVRNDRTVTEEGYAITPKDN